MMERSHHRPLVRRRAPTPPSRGFCRVVRTRSLPKLEDARRYGTDDGELYVSAHIPMSEHPLVLETFRRHFRSRVGRDVTFDGEPLTESSFESASGTIRLVTSVETATSYAYYDWEEKP